jgi:exosortase K
VYQARRLIVDRVGKVTPFTHLRTLLTRNAAFYAMGFLIVLALKTHYSRAASDQLEWILSPTATVVECFTGIRFEREAHAGAISREYGIILAPACAGVNFLIIVFSTLWFSILHRAEGTGRKLLWLGMSAAIAYLLTLGVNGLRIVVSVFLYRADIYGEWITPDRVHRIEGALIYFSFLALIYPVGAKAAEWLNGRQSRERGCPTEKDNGCAPLASVLAIPFAWYALVTVVTPFLNQAWRQNGARFVEHCCLVVAACSMVLLLFLLVVLGSRGIRSRIDMLKGRGRLDGAAHDRRTSIGHMATKRESVT